jgi:hypothetical protein
VAIRPESFMILTLFSSGANYQRFDVNVSEKIGESWSSCASTPINNFFHTLHSVSGQPTLVSKPPDLTSKILANAVKCVNTLARLDPWSVFP